MQEQKVMLFQNSDINQEIIHAFNKNSLSKKVVITLVYAKGRCKNKGNTVLHIHFEQVG